MIPVLLAAILSPVGPVRDLGSDDFATRQRAVRTLRVSGVRSVPALAVAERVGDLHTRRTASRLLDPYRVRIQRVFLWVRLVQITSEYVTPGGDEEKRFYATPLGARYGMMQVAIDAGMIRQSHINEDEDNRTALPWAEAIPCWVWHVRMQWFSRDFYRSQ